MQLSPRLECCLLCVCGYATALQTFCHNQIGAPCLVVASQSRPPCPLVRLKRIGESWWRVDHSRAVMTLGRLHMQLMHVKGGRNRTCQALTWHESMAAQSWARCALRSM